MDFETFVTHYYNALIAIGGTILFIAAIRLCILLAAGFKIFVRRYNRYE